MPDELLPPPIGTTPLPPPALSPEQQNLCRRLDELYDQYGLEVKPSKMFQGAIFAIRRECQRNPDGIAQAAHSLREIIYPFWSPQVKTVPDKRGNALKKYGAVSVDKEKVGKVWGQLNDLAHHRSASTNFEQVIENFVSVMLDALKRQIDIHKESDQILSGDPTQLDKEQLRNLIHVNLDARQYFYAKADERWLDWLWENEFLDVIRERAEDPTRYGEPYPELNFLVRMSEKTPAKVVDIMLQVPISSETFNPVVVDRFLVICRTLPAKQLARVVEKIRNERWILLMSAFRLLGFEYKKMFKTLADAKNYQSLLVLAEAVLAVRTQEKMEKTPRRHRDMPFYFDDLSSTEVFKHLAQVDAEYMEQAFDLVTKVMADIITLSNKKLVLSDQEQLLQLTEQAFGDEEESEKVFKVDDRLLLYDVDFFDLEPGREDRLSSEDGLRELAAVIKVLAQTLIGDRCDKPEAIRDVYIRYVGDFDNPDAKLPDSPTMWRLRLFVLSLCPETFKDELKKALFRLFEVEQYHEITRGTEYKKALQKGFAALSEQDKRHYVKRVVEYFAQPGQGQETDEENWRIRDGSRILSVIASQLTEEEKSHAEEAEFKLDPNYQPKPRIGRPRVGTIVPRGPITQEEFGELSIAQIAEKLRNEWEPNELTKQNTTDDFLNPRNADGVSKSLKGDIPNRLQEYVRNAAIFFERGVLDEHYTYSFLWGIQETIHAHSEIASNVNWDGVIDLCMAIKVSGEKDPFEEERREPGWFDTFRASWGAVHFAMTEILQALLTEKNGLLSIDFGAYRDRIFSLAGYLLSHPDPSPEDEQIETAKSKTKSSGDADFMISDPLHMAVNSVRGQAFKAFAFFVDQDGKKFKKEDAVKISSDVKELYEVALEKETTRALMFMFGQYLPFAYYRDRDWIRGILPQIFSQEPAKNPLYTAAWEGYLANNLYKEMFFDPEIQKLYERGLALTDADFPPQQEHFKKPDEGIAEHLALAFMHYKKFGFDHPLFEAFWKENNLERHASFVNFLGHSFVSGNNANAPEFLKRVPESKQRLKDFWDWLLENYENPKPFLEFDFWINLEVGLFEPVWLAERVRKTLEKTKGALDSDFKLTQSIVRLAKANPKDTLEIARLYLLEGGIRRGEQREILLGTEDWDQWVQAFKILHGNAGTKSKASALINILIQEGGNPFWDLKKITAM